MSNLRSTITRDSAGRSILLLSGAIDEKSDVAAALRGVTGDVVVNLEGIERINSIGIHRWIPAFTAFAASREVVIERLSYPFTLQANMVANLFGRGRVVSCLAPYFCPSCRQNRLAIVERGDVDAAGEPPGRSCAVCNTSMTFDELDKYFAFFQLA